MHYTIGIDESGTGAWAGPFVVCACILLEPVKGLRDSKKLSESKRIWLTAELFDTATALLCVKSVLVGDIRARGQQTVWEDAIVQVAGAAISKLTSRTPSSTFDIVVDGEGSKRLWNRLPRARFEAKADDKYPAVSGASIVAKTERNNLMRQIHGRYPQYGFDQHFGYGTPEHIRTLNEHGPCPQHRKIRGRT